MKKDYTFETLLELDGYVAEIGKGFWVKIEAKQVKASKGKPQGIKYSLTLHAPNGERIMGIDNAHAITSFPSKTKHDHMHINTRIKPYSYKDASTLLEDFWKKVESVLKENSYVKN